MLTKPPSRKSKIAEILKKEKTALTVNQLAVKAGLTPPQVRNVVSSKFDTPIVYAGGGKYDLANRMLRGFTFRYNVSALEVSRQNLLADDDLETLLEWQRSNTSISLTDPHGRKYVVKRFQPNKAMVYPHYRGLTAFFRRYSVNRGDNLLFSVTDFENREFLISCLSAGDRNWVEIKESNQKLADLVYDILIHLPQRQDWVIFFARRLLPLLVGIYPPPDNLVEALKGDRRFIIFSSSELGHTLVALSKFTVIFHPKRPSPVYIEKDAHGRYGFCGDCGIPLKWSLGSGWLHPHQDTTQYRVYRDEIELDKRFYNRD